jgi:hypothetical protein
MTETVTCYGKARPTLRTGVALSWTGTLEMEERWDMKRHERPSVI